MCDSKQDYKIVNYQNVQNIIKKFQLLCHYPRITYLIISIQWPPNLNYSVREHNCSITFYRSKTLLIQKHLLRIYIH